MEVNGISTFAIYRLTIATVLLTLMFVSATAIIEPQTDCCINSLIHVGNYSGCTKTYSKIEYNKNTPIILNHNNILELTLLCTIITVYILPISVVLPMGGECTNAAKVIPQNHKDTSTSNVTTNKQTGKRKRKRSSNNNGEGEGGDDNGAKKPKRTGRPSNFTNHICSQCTSFRLPPTFA